jgi:hypothetical protein
MVINKIFVRPVNQLIRLFHYTTGYTYIDIDAPVILSGRVEIKINVNSTIVLGNVDAATSEVRRGTANYCSLNLRGLRCYFYLWGGLAR